MIEEILRQLTSRDERSACAAAAQIVAQSEKTDQWYRFFDDFAELLNHEKSLVRNRALHILAANARWDEEDRFRQILPSFLTHVTDEKPITARQCVQALAAVGASKPALIPDILERLKCADLSKYKDSMRPLIEKDIQETVRKLTSF